MHLVQHCTHLSPSIAHDSPTIITLFDTTNVLFCGLHHAEPCFRQAARNQSSMTAALCCSLCRFSRPVHVQLTNICEIVKREIATMQQERSRIVAARLLLPNRSTPALQLNVNAKLMLDGYLDRASKLLADVQTLHAAALDCETQSVTESELATCLSRKDAMPDVKAACERLQPYFDARTGRLVVSADQVNAPLFLLQVGGA